ncbi:substrate-binding domain-containing protein [Actinophytocola algeriensis]|uniref:Ribose transport system substrate-binding protein n=1 Tax=Actinophytocola algeriensis TaxID=1768010 RepID=A0A7W7QF66_9PSEU|nr:substrate-binding domain-containing protein [Actinophytocola algeriensis]MBB4912384.1 ribose transport system substrate-binding protein [Actinophytocola algeriensis]MBE1481043.1 ribose transport system substrate-binding protein [Actinophytocola algeriensis]
MARRRAVAAVLTAATALSLSVSCGTTSENSGQGGGGAQESECGGPDGKYTIGMSQANVAEPYRQRMDDDIKAAAESVPQFSVEFADAQQDNAKQVSDVENFLTKQIDLLIISPNEATPLTAVVAKAYNKGIPVIVLDRKVDGDAYTTWIGADNVEIGRTAGEYVATTLLPNGGKIGEIRGLAGSTPAKERGDGFREGIEGKDIEIVQSVDGDWLREKGQSQADALFKAHPDIQVLYAHNDPMAEGAYLAAKAAGIEKNLKFIGIDGLPIPSGGLKAVEQGRLSATLIYPTGGAEAVDTAKKLLVDCQDVPKEQTLETELITIDNAATVYNEANS